MSIEIKITKTSSPKAKPDQDNLPFGEHFTDHMFVMDYTEGQGWHDPRIVPYGPLQLDPSTMVFHYGQAMFEGLKAYRGKDGKNYLFRPYANMERANISNERLCIPPLDVDFAVEAIRSVVDYDRDWIPAADGTSLYVRPFIISTDPYLGVRPSLTYKFMVIMCPVGAYYPEGIDPVKIYVETNYVRAVKGGTGYIKTPGNYAASLKAQVEAMQRHYTQVLWLDAVHKEYVEEVGTMNVMFKIDGTVVTPALEGSILGGITRDSALTVLKHWGVPVEERSITIDEVYQAHEQGRLEEAFGTGTAAVISPIGELNWDGRIITLNKGEIGEISRRLYDTITGIQYGEVEDPFGWRVEVR